MVVICLLLAGFKHAAKKKTSILGLIIPNFMRKLQGLKVSPEMSGPSLLCLGICYMLKIWETKGRFCDQSSARGYLQILTAEILSV